MDNIIYLSAFQQMIWIVLIILFSVVIYSWTKSKISNNTFAVILTIVLIYLVFIQYPHFVWVAVIGIILYYANFADIKKIFKQLKF